MKKSEEKGEERRRESGRGDGRVENGDAPRSSFTCCLRNELESSTFLKLELIVETGVEEEKGEGRERNRDGDGGEGERRQEAVGQFSKRLLLFAQQTNCTNKGPIFPFFRLISSLRPQHGDHLYLIMVHSRCFRLRAGPPSALPTVASQQRAVSFYKCTDLPYQIDDGQTEKGRGGVDVMSPSKSQGSRIVFFFSEGKEKRKRTRRVTLDATRRA